MRKIVQTTTSLEFQSMDTGTFADGLHYDSYRFEPGFMCHLSYEDEERGVLIPLRYPNLFAEARRGDYESANGMVLLAEVRAGNIPNEALEEFE